MLMLFALSAMTSDLSVVDNVQMLSHGSADLILEACTDFWDGTDIYPLSGSDRCSICHTDHFHFTVNLQSNKVSGFTISISKRYHPYHSSILYFSRLSICNSLFVVSHVPSHVTERRFWTSTSVPVCQVTAQHLLTNPCKWHCPAN